MNELEHAAMHCGRHANTIAFLNFRIILLLLFQTGNNEKTLVAILAAGRPASGAVDEELAQKEAQELYDEGEGKMGTDSALFRKIFCTRSWAQLQATCQVLSLMM